MSFFKNLAGLNKKMNVSINAAGEEPAEAFMNMPDTAAAPVDEAWLTDDYKEGQLAIDVYQTPSAIVVKSTVAGVKPEDIDIAINNDMLTIRGARQLAETVANEDYFYQECYWGSFSRSIILPFDVKKDAIEANLENGVLTITLPKADAAKQIFVKVTE